MPCLAKSRAYPRERGGNFRPPDMLRGDAGLSPRARGKHCENLRQSLPDGPIPASAGETLCAGYFRQCAGAYPRERGGNIDAEKPLAQSKGLSPRARGKRMAEGIRVRGMGPIPASAGETYGEIPTF